MCRAARSLSYGWPALPDAGLGTRDQGPLPAHLQAMPLGPPRACRHRPPGPAGDRSAPQQAPARSGLDAAPLRMRYLTTTSSRIFGWMAQSTWKVPETGKVMLTVWPIPCSPESKLKLGLETKTWWMYSSSLWIDKVSPLSTSIDAGMNARPFCEILTSTPEPRAKPSDPSVARKTTMPQAISTPRISATSPAAGDVPYAAV